MGTEWHTTKQVQFRIVMDQLVHAYSSSYAVLIVGLSLHTDT